MPPAAIARAEDLEIRPCDSGVMDAPLLKRQRDLSVPREMVHAIVTGGVGGVLPYRTVGLGKIRLLTEARGVAESNGAHVLGVAARSWSRRSPSD